jgi:ribosomal protein L36
MKIKVPINSKNFEIGNNLITKCLFFTVGLKRDSIGLGDFRTSKNITKKSKIIKKDDHVMVINET